MALLDLSAYKVTNNASNLDATVQDSMIDSIVAVVNALTDANIDPAAAIAISKLNGYPATAGKYVDGQGNWTIPNGTLNYRKTTTTDVVNTTTLTDFAALAIGAGAIGANGIVVARAWGDYLNNTGSTQTLSINTLFGGSPGLGISATVASNASRFAWRADWIINNQNATNVQEQFVEVNWGVSAPAMTVASSAIDTTASVTARLRTTLPTASASLSVRCHGMIMQVFNG